MRLIDLEELQKYPIRINSYDKKNGNVHFVYGIESLMEYAEQLPTINPEDLRPKGRWDFPVIGKHGCLCSLCRKQADNPYDYCPNGGAKMDLEVG